MQTAVETLIQQLEASDILDLFGDRQWKWEDIKRNALKLEKAQSIRVGDIVECVKEDRMDVYFEEHNCWQIGERFEVKKIETLPYGTFLHDGNGHNMCIKRAKLITK